MLAPLTAPDGVSLAIRLPYFRKPLPEVLLTVMAPAADTATSPEGVTQAGLFEALATMIWPAAEAAAMRAPLALKLSRPLGSAPSWTLPEPSKDRPVAALSLTLNTVPASPRPLPLEYWEPARSWDQVVAAVSTMKPLVLVQSHLVFL